MKRLYGVTVAMVTPFRDNGTVDITAIKELTEFLIEQNVNGLYPCGTTGEMLKLSEAERKTVAETVVEQAKGRLPVFIHVGAATTEETVRLAVHAKMIGADGIGVVTPQFIKATDKEIETYYGAVAEAVKDFPVYLYNIPQCSGNDLPAYICEQIVEKHPNVIGIKYSYGDMERTVEYLQVHGGAFSVLHGMDKIFSGLLAMGCDGTVSGCAGIFPEPYVNIYQAYLKKDYSEMLRWQNVAIQVGDALKNGSNMSWFKEALRLRGLTVGGMRSPQMDIGEEEKRELAARLNAICETYGITLKVKREEETV